MLCVAFEVEESEGTAGMQLRWSSNRRIQMVIDIYEDEIAKETWKELSKAWEKGHRVCCEAVKALLKKAGVPEPQDVWSAAEGDGCWKEGETGGMLQLMTKVKESNLDKATTVSGGLNGGLVGLHIRAHKEAGVRKPEHDYKVIWLDKNGETSAAEAIALGRKVGVLAKGIFRGYRGRGVRCQNKEWIIKEVKKKLGQTAEEELEVRSHWVVEGFPAGMAEEDIQETLKNWNWETKVGRSWRYWEEKGRIGRWRRV